MDHDCFDVENVYHFVSVEGEWLRFSNGHHYKPGDIRTMISRLKRDHADHPNADAHIKEFEAAERAHFSRLASSFLRHPNRHRVG